MVIPKHPDPVKLFIGILSNQQSLFPEIESLLSKLRGTIDYKSETIPFDCTEYYAPEMGSGILRYFISFSQLIDPGELANIKLQTNNLELKFAESGKRKANFDPGYLDFHKVVLASGKFGGPKIYLSDGIYADMTLRFLDGKFLPFDWGFPDFRSGSYNEIFMKIRNLYKQNLRKNQIS
ncbi:MAG: hypothetical protein A2161_03085 [Candidatus Schekmanbacteria bacterium RBG_13_48_7]|uniref:GTP-binding protein n=1 Tax=Candidatus Schekmanbacteria bacterium RBG_13_48_7 TaxID=1817878 RepID=A0A1F7RY86_9BACT|nr:MAG: hypothetical protein A2161_03085 [Candidatus Schekmanbacteria bacterium RBG_13_48_7]